MIARAAGASGSASVRTWPAARSWWPFRWWLGLPDSRRLLPPWLFWWAYGAYTIWPNTWAQSPWSWLADVAPQRIRGRFLGIRERLELLPARRWAWPASGCSATTGRRAITMRRGWVGSPTHVPSNWGRSCRRLRPWCPRPDARHGRHVRTMPAGRTAGSERSWLGASLLRAPFADGRFVRLMLFGCWFSLA